VNEIVALALILLLATSGYAAGRVHAQFSYRTGYRHGYRQGYFDGDRASWTRRRRDLQAAVASVLAERPESFLDHSAGTTYTSVAHRDAEDGPVEVPAPDRPEGRHARSDHVRSQPNPAAMVEIASDR
jgi:hypothetical protein